MVHLIVLDGRQTVNHIVKYIYDGVCVQLCLWCGSKENLMQKKMLSLSLLFSVCLPQIPCHQWNRVWVTDFEGKVPIYLAFPSVVFICCANDIGVIFSCCQGKENKDEDRNEKKTNYKSSESEQEREREEKRESSTNFTLFPHRANQQNVLYSLDCCIFFIVTQSHYHCTNAHTHTNRQTSQNERDKKRGEARQKWRKQLDGIHCDCVNCMHRPWIESKTSRFMEI